MNTQYRNQMPKAFSMVELLAIVTIISLLAVFAIPAYLNHIAATKLNSLWQLAEPAKLYVESAYLKHNTAVTSITVDANTAEVTTPGSNLARCITIQNGVISVVGDPDKFYDQVLWVAWTPSVVSGNLTWTCTYAAAAATYIGDTAPNCSVGAAAYLADIVCNP